MSVIAYSIGTVHQPLGRNNREKTYTLLSVVERFQLPRVNFQLLYCTCMNLYSRVQYSTAQRSTAGTAPEYVQVASFVERKPSLTEAELENAILVELLHYIVGGVVRLRVATWTQVSQTTFFGSQTRPMAPWATQTPKCAGVSSLKNPTRVHVHVPLRLTAKSYYCIATVGRTATDEFVFSTFPQSFT